MDQTPSDAPERFGRYRVIAKLNEGRTGTVYKVLPDGGGRPMALKVLATAVTNSPIFRERFIRGARATSVVQSPHIVAITDMGIEMPSGRAWCAMELVDGRSLREELNAAGEGTALPAPIALFIGKQLCSAVGALHAGGVIHRNIKPANVLLTSRNQTRHFVRMVGFGLVKLCEPEASGEELTQRGAVLGTPAYMAPEALIDSSAVDQAADIYSLGVVLYEMFFGHLPYGKLTSRSVIDQLVAKQAGPPRFGIEPLIDQLLARMLSPNPTARPFSADDVLGTLAMSSLEDDAPTSLDLNPRDQYDGLSDPNATNPGKRR